MKKILLLTLVSISYLLGNSQTYSIRIGLYNYLDNAIKVQQNSKYDVFIDLNQKPYITYIGQFQTKKEARERLKDVLKYYSDAYIIFSPKDKINKKKKDLNFDQKEDNEDFFKEGLEYYNSRDYEEALMAFDRELIVNPDNLEAKFYYAKTLYLLKIYKSSKKSFKELNEQKISNKMKKDIKKYLSSIDNKLTTNRFYTSIDISTTYDDNLNYATYKDKTNYNGKYYENNTTDIKGSYQNINLSITHIYKNDYITWANNFYSYNEIQNKNSIDDINYLYFATSISKKYKDIKLSMPLGFTYLLLDQKSEYSSIFISSYISYLLSNSSQVKVGLRYEDFDNKDDKAKGYKNSSLSLNYTKIYNSFMFYSTLILAQDKKSYDGIYDLNNRQKEVKVGVKYDFSKKMYINILADFQNKRYTDIAPAIGYKRDDKKSTITTLISRDITKNSSLYTKYTNIYNNSNIGNYSYRKDSFSLGINIEF